jgi:nucleoid-associated protein YejK
MRFITQQTELQVLKKYSEVSELEVNTTSKVRQQVDELLSEEFNGGEKLDYKDLIQVLNKI